MAGGPISWLSKKQAIVVLSTSEAEYIALSLATREVEWLRKMLIIDLKVASQQPTTLMEDNQGAIAIARNPVAHARTKHIGYHYIHEAMQNGIVNLCYCPTEVMIADILTKPLPKERFEMLRDARELKIPGVICHNCFCNPAQNHHHHWVINGISAMPHTLGILCWRFPL